MIVDCHAHLVPASLLDAIRAAHANFPSVKLIEEGGSLGFAFAGNKPTRPVSKPLSDIAARLQWLDTNGSIRDSNAAVNLARWGQLHHEHHHEPRTPKQGGRAINARRRDGTDQHLMCAGETIPVETGTDRSFRTGGLN